MKPWKRNNLEPLYFKGTIRFVSRVCALLSILAHHRRPPTGGRLPQRRFTTGKSPFILLALLSVGPIIVIVMGIPAVGNTQTCFSGKPLPACRTFFVSDVTYGNQADGNISTGHLVSPELGLMVNVNKKHAVGVSGFLEFFFDSDYDDSRVGLKAKYRFWLNRSFNLNAAAGGAVSDKESPLALTEVYAFYRNWVGVGARIDWSGTSYTGSGPAYYGTVKVGDWLGLSVTGVFVVLAVVVSVVRAGQG